MHLLIALLLLATPGFAASTGTLTPAATATPRPLVKPRKPEEVDVRNLKEKYWARGEKAELEVVQNRTYRKQSRIKAQIFGGLVTTDPFLSVKDAGLALGYFFTENWGFQAIYWKDLVSNSSALNTLETVYSATTGVNRPNWFGAGEFLYSPLYGKLSFLGSSILYFDFYAIFGAGITNSATGKYVTPELGIGQQVYIARQLALSLEARAFRYSETTVAADPNYSTAKVDTTSVRTTYSTSVNLGLVLFI